jgi:hypothetical protein
MHLHRFIACLGLAAGLALSRAEEQNNWPVRVVQTDSAGTVTSTAWAGPFFFAKPSPEGGQVAGFRPFYVERTQASGQRVEISSLYPLFTYRADDDSYTWSVFNLINRTGRTAGASPKLAAVNHEGFDVWPFYFSRTTGDPATSYRGLLPIAGTIKNFFGYERISWILFPLYVQVDKRGATTTLAPWPILRVTRGAEQGFALWPLFGWRERPREFQQRYFLWPLMWNNTQQPPDDAPAGTPATHQVGFIPFYTRETRPGYFDQNFVWPFFGSTDRTQPYRYHETRYLWPFFVQAKGDDRMIDRWGPFYTHSVIKGYDKTWIGWPVWRHATWEEDGVAQNQTTVLFRLYWSLEQRSLTNPSAAPATKTHLWPLYSGWDNGAGRRQYQVISPFEVLFPHNDIMREDWTPLFALYRYDQVAPGENRSSLLWDAITWEHGARESRSAFHLGPLFSIETHAAEKRIALGNGLLGFHRSGDNGAWHLFWLDFPSKRAHTSTATNR